MKNAPKRMFLPAAFAVMLCAAIFAGCQAPPEKKEPANGKPVVGVLVYRKDDMYLNLVTQAIENALSGRAEVRVFSAESDQALQNSQIDALIREGVHGLALNLVDTQSVAMSIGSIKKAGIPVVMFNREPDPSGIKSYHKARFVGTPYADAGRMQGEIIKDLWEKHPEYDKNKDGLIQYIMIQASLDNLAALARSEYSVKRARENGLSLRQLGETLLCGWDESEAYAAIKVIFPLYGEDMELIIANNDAMALGAIRALNEFGYNLPGGEPSKYIPVVGIDAVPAAVEAVKNGSMAGTVIQDSGAMGKTVADMLMNAVEGKDFLEGIPFSWDSSGIAVRIPYFRYVDED